MADECIKRCSTIIGHQGDANQNNNEYHHTAMRVAQIQNIAATKHAGEDAKQQEVSFTPGENVSC